MFSDAGFQEKLGDYGRLPLLSICLTTPQREGGNEWWLGHMPVYPECLFNTSRVTGGSWICSRLFAFLSWCSASLSTGFCHREGGRPFPLEPRPVLGGKIGHGRANNSKNYANRNQYFPFSTVENEVSNGGKFTEA